MTLKFKIRFNKNKKVDIENWMNKEYKDYLNSQKELRKIDDKIIETLAISLEEKFKRKKIEYNGDEIREQLHNFREGWEFEYKVDEDRLHLSWEKHPLIDYKNEETALILYKFFKGRFSHIFKDSIFAVVRFLKSFRDPTILLRKEEDTVKKMMISKQYEEIKSTLKKIDANALIEFEEKS